MGGWEGGREGGREGGNPSKAEYPASSIILQTVIGRSEYTRGRHWRHGHFSNIVILAEFWHVMFKQLTSNTIFLR